MALSLSKISSHVIVAIEFDGTAILEFLSSRYIGSY